MKGMVFTEFLEMVEDVFSADVVDALLDRADLPSGGIYTSLGSYGHTEMLDLVGLLSEHTGLDSPHLVQTFGTHLFSRFYKHHPDLFEGTRTAFDFMEKVDAYIHVEVAKLYPNAELPKFAFTRHSPSCLEMRYDSKRPFADLAYGLILGCAKHYEISPTVDYELLGSPPQERTSARFTITLTE